MSLPPFWNTSAPGVFTVDRRCCLACALLAAALVFAWQWLTVRVNYGGNWTALFCTGARHGAPPTLAAEHIYLFPGSYGYDGQMYHYIAHDPLLHDPDLEAYIDAPRLRWRRILVPALAYLLAAGRQRWIDPAYYALVLFFTAAGVYWTAAGSRLLGLSAAWGLLFLLLPSTLVSMDRMVVDGALTALAAGFAYYLRAPSWRLFIILAAAPLVRETGFLLLAAWCGYLMLQRRPGRAALYALAAVPAFAWYAWVETHTAAEHYPINFKPLSSVWALFWHPVPYPAGVRLAWLATISDRLALLGMVAAFALALYWNGKRHPGAMALAALCFAAMGIVLQGTVLWTNVYSFGRVYSPLLLFLGLESLERSSGAALLPLSLMWPRIGMQIGSQAVGILSALKKW